MGRAAKLAIVSAKAAALTAVLAIASGLERNSTAPSCSTTRDCT